MATEQNFLISKQPLILASGSPRRAEILNAVGWPFEAITAGIDETLGLDEQPLDYVQRLAREKAQAVAAKLEAGLVLGADTTVVVEGELLGQPEDDEDARRMLRLLSGKWHEVLTGVALVRIGDDTRVDYERTWVRFAEMSEEEVAWYVASGEPKGKAGAYGIQGKASLFISGIEGDYFNIVGLPVHLVFRMAQRMANPQK
jgi:septum formation protein